MMNNELNDKFNEIKTRLTKGLGSLKHKKRKILDGVEDADLKTEVLLLENDIAWLLKELEKRL